MIAVRSLLFNVTFYIWTTFMLVICLPILIFDRKITVRCQKFWANGVLWMMRSLVGITLDIRGRQHLGPASAIIASKHQSAWDTLIWHVIVDDPAVVMKSELLWIPIYGWYSLKAEMIPVNRDGGASTLKAMIRSAQKAAHQRRPIIIFPQGTRTAPGAHEPYQPGVVALYRGLNLPVVPVALNSGFFWPRRSLKRNPGTIVVKFLPPIAPGLDRKKFMTALEEKIETATDTLETEAYHQSKSYSRREA
jgi:1-acyl-sn-glycerol-3-phosphate acyltransferase